jgi:tetratricopeptide (TPR) repeat protein
LLLFPVLLLLLIGCSTETVYVNVVRPGVVDLTQYKYVAVDDFQGNGGIDMTEELTVALTAARSPLTGDKAVKIVERTKFNQILGELRRQRGSLWDQETIVRLGNLVAAAALIHGRVSDYRYKETKTPEYWKDREKKQHVTWTRTGTAHISVFIKINATETGTHLDSVKYDVPRTVTRKATDKQPPAIDGNALLTSLRREIASKFIRRVLPYKERVAVELFYDGDFPELEVGNNYARVGGWEKALENYKKALDRMVGEMAEYRYMGLYNVGVAYGFLNRFSDAREALQEAYALYADAFIAKELSSLARREAEYKKLHRSEGSGMNLP